jgi:hypothetical protein
LFVVNDFEYAFVDIIHDVVIGRSLMAVRNFLMRSEGKERNFGKRMVYEKKKEMCEKYLKMPPGWILGTIKRELNLYASGGETLEDL